MHLFDSMNIGIRMQAWRYKCYYLHMKFEQLWFHKFEIKLHVCIIYAMNIQIWQLGYV